MSMAMSVKYNWYYKLIINAWCTYAIIIHPSCNCGRTLSNVNQIVIIYYQRLSAKIAAMVQSEGMRNASAELPYVNSQRLQLMHLLRRPLTSIAQTKHMTDVEVGC